MTCQVSGSDLLRANYNAIQLRSLINSYRASRGLGKLAGLMALTMPAQWMANDQAKQWDAGKGISHVDSEGRDPWRRMGDCEYDQNAWKGENIGAGFQTPQSMLKGWQDSPGHNSVLIGAQYRYIGIGVQVSKKSKQLIWVADFASEYDASYTLLVSGGGGPVAVA